MSKIAFVVPSLGMQEGQGNANMEMLRRVARAGHEVDVYTSAAPPHVQSMAGVRVRMLPRLPAWQLGNQLLMLTGTGVRVRHSRYDLIHADAGSMAGRADVLMVHTVSDRWRDVPAAVVREPGIRGAHYALATKFKARLEIRQALHARAVFANSEMTSRDLAARGVDPTRITVVPFGVDEERFRPPSEADRRSARDAFGIAQDAFVVGFVGAHGARKGLPEALDALQAARAGEVLLVAGEHRGGTWARAATERKLPVVMPGKLDDVRRAYWSADVLAYPSHYDAFGMAVLEAMACGLPVVVSRSAGSHEIVRDAGFVLSDLEPRSLRLALDALRDDPERRKQMGRRAREIARARNWDKCGAIILDRYAELLDAAKGRATSAR